jgi:predicted dehydrogenase
MVPTSNSPQFTKSDFDKPEFRGGIIGTGGIAKAFARDLSYFNSHIVQAVGSRSLEKASDFALEFPSCTAYGSYEELVSDPMIDAVYVATPHPQHVTNTILALNAGKPVLCEKPFAVNAIQAQDMVVQAKRDAEHVAERIKTEAQSNAERLLDRARSEIETAKQSALSELSLKSTDIAFGLARKVIGRELKTSDHEQLIKDALGRLPSGNSNN